MTTIFVQPSPWQRARRVLTGFDPVLLGAILALAIIGLVAMYSAGFDHGTRFAHHGRNMALGFALALLVAQLPPHKIERLAVPMYAAGLVLLVAVALFGITRKGATRWLNLGIVIQPSEIMKIAMPLMLAWWFQKREGHLRAVDHLLAALLLVLPVALIVRQPDLGTAVLVLASGLYVIFFAGLSWRLVLPLALLAGTGIAALVLAQETLCEGGLRWPVLREYQQHRVCTLLDPTRDPLGKGFHMLQGQIAIGSGGFAGKGFMQGTQTHLEFIPERTTDFIFAAFCEEFGFVGAAVLLLAFSVLVLRGLMIAAEAPTMFSRLLAAAVTTGLFTYGFVNMGMVSGILPVVGVPLPFVSYGGTAMVVLGLGLGVLMSVARSRQLMRS